MRRSPKRPPRTAAEEPSIRTLAHHARLAAAYAALARDLARLRGQARRLSAHFSRKAAALARRLGVPGAALAGLARVLVVEEGVRKKKKGKRRGQRVPQ